MNLQVVGALASAIDAKDTYTNGHSSRVAEYSRMIAERAGYSRSDQGDIYMMGLLHDVGKIGVPDEAKDLEVLLRNLIPRTESGRWLTRAPSICKFA